ncbi:putative thermolabile hemolysin [Legionella moravica]|uniref:Thermolabile hemolysin n=1 Tax=Legionella moravica TaxID=39962 RepID=A0A378JWJ4_9GAMM|nr:SGNH/GDSL hydrolase family protein [Legionella moravica]KTD35676.1 putative thermolabile hemolysin [Legionella moravica]STX62806.1 thermolabile hemolysin [Legionella moravica]
MIKPAIKISSFVVLGDSLSDRGTLNKRYAAGVLPMRIVSGLSSKSPRGRFTNGFLWGDYVTASTAEQFQIDSVRKKLNLDKSALSNADISDYFISNHLSLGNHKLCDFSLNNDKHVLFQGQRFARFYCEGGLTSHNYSGDFTFNLVLWFTRLLLSHLSSKVNLLIQDDKAHKISRAEKLETLVIEWSGANDLITVNSEPTHLEVDKAIADRIANMENLIKHGYRNLLLFNLPDLGLTPRYQAKSKALRNNAAECSAYFNAQLELKVQELNNKYLKSYPNLYLSVYDVSGLFNEVYNNPKAYDFDETKIKTPYITSDEFKKNQKNPEEKAKHTSPSEGFMFWDDVHPTADMQAWLGDKFNEKYREIFNFVPPAKKARLESKEAWETLEKINDTSNPKTLSKLPDDTATMLRSLYAYAQTMCNSRSPLRVKKGQLLEQFVFDVKLQRGNLDDIYRYIKQFTRDTENMELLSARKHSVYDFFTSKKTTESVDRIMSIKSNIKEHMKGSLSNAMH